MPGIELFGAEERREVMDVLDTGVLFRYNHDDQRNGHWKTRTLEQEFAAYHGAPYAHAVSSGSTAIMTALAACGVGAGDEVIVPPFTYIATIEAVLLLGAVPIFAEIDDTLNLSPEGVRAAITPRTRAVALVHMCGAPPRLTELMDVCRAHQITLVEDTAQALGATYNGKPLGTFGGQGLTPLISSKSSPPVRAGPSLPPTRPCTTIATSILTMATTTSATTGAWKATPYWASTSAWAS